MATRTQILISARDGASSVFSNVAKSSTRAQKRIFGVNSALQSTDKSIDSLTGSLKGLAVGATAGLGLGALATSVKDAIAIKIEYDKINNTLKAVTGSSQAAATEFNFLSTEAERLGLELRPLAQTYTRLAAAGNQLGLSTENTREIFTSFSEALTGFGATREQSIRVFTAIEQILSKGKVSAEELRQQLGEALPGAFQLAAKAAGVTVQELDELLKKGELFSSDFILPFAKVIRTEFGGAAVEGAKLLNAEFGRTLNVLDEVKLAFTEGGLSDSIANILKNFRTFIGEEERLKRFAEAGQTLGTGLELAAKSMQTIAQVVSNIPTEVILALGAVALRGRGGSGSGAGPLTNFNSSTAFAGTNSFGAQRLQERIRARSAGFRGESSALATGPRAAIRKTVRTFNTLTRTVIDLVGPFNLILATVAPLAAGLRELNNQNKRRLELEFSGRQTEAITRGANIVGQFRAQGVNVVGANAEEILREVAIQMEDIFEITPALVREFAALIEKGNQVPEAVKKVTKAFEDTSLLAVETAQEQTKEIKAQTAILNSVGEARFEEVKRSREFFKALKEENVTRAEAVKLTRENAAALKEFSDAQKQQRTLTGLSDFRKETERIQEEANLRGSLSEKAFERVKRIREIFSELTNIGVAPLVAGVEAIKRFNAEQANVQGSRFELDRRSAAVGVATNARSVEAALKKQQQKEDVRAARLQTSMDATATSLENIDATISQFNTSFA